MEWIFFSVRIQSEFKIAMNEMFLSNRQMLNSIIQVYDCEASLITDIPFTMVNSSAVLT